MFVSDRTASGISSCELLCGAQNDYTTTPSHGDFSFLSLDILIVYILHLGHAGWRGSYLDVPMICMRSFRWGDGKDTRGGFTAGI